MHLCDHNIWLALVLSLHSHHRRVHAWVAESTPSSLAFCRASQQGFLRLLTTDVVLRPYGIPARTNREAWAVYRALARDERITFLSEPPGLEEMWHRLSDRGRAEPKTWMDAYLAAFALTSDIALATTDFGFRKFEGEGLELDLLEV